MFVTPQLYQLEENTKNNKVKKTGKHTSGLAKHFAKSAVINKQIKVF